MIGVFENMVRLNPQRTCFSYVDKDGNIEALSYRETRMIAAGLASLLRRRGVALGDAVAVDLPNQPACVFLLLAAAYGGFTLVTLNNRLTDAEKQARLLDLQRSRAFNVAYTVDESNVANLIRTVANDATGTAEAAGPGHAQRTSFYARTNIATAEARSTRALGRAGRSRGAAARRAFESCAADLGKSVWLGGGFQCFAQSSRRGAVADRAAALPRGRPADGGAQPAECESFHFVSAFRRRTRAGGRRAPRRHAHFRGRQDAAGHVGEFACVGRGPLRVHPAWRRAAERADAGACAGHAGARVRKLWHDRNGQSNCKRPGHTWVYGWYVPA